MTPDPNAPVEYIRQQVAIHERTERELFGVRMAAIHDHDRASRRLEDWRTMLATAEGSHSQTEAGHL